MLSEIADSGQSEETLDRTTLSFRTRVEKEQRLIRKEYTFTYAKEWDEWHLYEYTEESCDSNQSPLNRVWKSEERMFWTDNESVDISIPPEVTRALRDTLGSDVNIVRG